MSYSYRQVLHIDDDPLVREFVKIVLEHESIMVESVPDSTSAFKFLEQHRVDLMLIDCELSDENGKNLISQISLKYPNIKIIFLSGHSEQDIYPNGLPSSAVGFLEKADSLDDLPHRIENILNKRVFTHDDPKRTAAVEHENKLNELSAKYRHYLRNKQSEIEELWQNVKNQPNHLEPTKKLLSQLHAISGTSGLHGIMNVCQLAGNLEDKVQEFVDHFDEASPKNIQSLNNEINQLLGILKDL